MKRVILFVAVGIFLLCFLLKGNSTKAQEETTSLRGHVYGVLEIPKEEMENIPEEFKSKKAGKEMIINFKDGRRETRVGIRGWTVSVDGRKSLTNKKGEFFLPNLASGKAVAVISFQGYKLLKQRINLVAGEENLQDFVFKSNLRQFSKVMGGEEQGDDHSVVMKKKKVKCLKSNYWCTIPYLSDCYKALQNLNPYCWKELVSDSGRWCNGKRNCSPSIGHPEEEHCDYTDH